MRGSLFSLRSGSNSVVGSPTQTPTTAPAPSSRPDSGVYVADIVEPLSLPPSAAGDITSLPNLPRARPLSRLGLTAFRKPSPAPARPRDNSLISNPISNIGSATPVVSTPPASPAIPAVAAAAAVGAGSVSYLDALSLKLGEAVSKALLVQPAASHATMSMGIPKTGTVNGVKTAIGSGVDGSDTVLKGKKPLPAGRGRALGTMIAK